MPEYTLFLGCIIPARFPFMEKSTRLVLSQLGCILHDLEGATCCPTKSIIKPIGDLAWYVTAARNLAIAQKAGHNLLVPCNGCYSTLKSVEVEMRINPGMRDEVNAILAFSGLEYTGAVEVKHLVEVLHDEIGLPKIKQHLIKSFDGMRIAPHYGCHMLRPSSSITFDDPNKPRKFDALIEALGAKSIDYGTKMLCCGGNLNTADEPEEATALARMKLMEVTKKADAITLTCPSCFMQYDSRQYMMQKTGEKLNVPVLFYPELLGLAMGFSTQELGMDMHRIDPAEFLSKWDLKYKYLKTLKEVFDLSAIRKCYECAACVNDCPVVKVNPDFNPNEIIGRLLSGELEAVIGSHNIWQCVDCYTCYELCPQKMGMNKIFDKLKHMAVEKGKGPKGFAASIEMFRKDGRLGEPTGVRKKLKLAESPKSGGEELKKLLDHINNKGEENEI
ncbi:MAG: heterodisulfide reductase-related iron-sulfur binding cluster [Candidatus Methanoperedens sp.]|nr:heterodisulfide reductase-related iron-sulfur binding cluster [Candidatus Methanoperedens sp. BLZ2]MBZ0174823.1 4Fe-4S dicluster domain-containing protein [Candidatus Methanoperedens nitroreducens]MCX9076976.1 heterodisulfide reductase-related iron-sulfur binding cluster [Candidatus Methanoperedens sp.]